MTIKSQTISLANRLLSLAGVTIRPMRGLERQITGWEVLKTTRSRKRSSEDGQAVRHSDGTIVSTVDSGRSIAWFVMNPKDVIQSEHMRGKFYEQEELDIIRSLYKGGVFVDIGANVGNHALFAARNLGAPRVICFEPNPAAFEILKLNFLLNEVSDRLDLRTVGLSDRADMLPLVASENNLGDGRFGDTTTTSDQTLQVLVGDEQLTDVAPGFVKIDVEGMEIRVLAGLRELIGRSRPPMLVEVDAANDRAFVEFLASIDYRIVRTCTRYTANCNYAISAS
jgi:FkbM family methyltransferase